MTNKNKISVRILGKEHYLISTDHPEYVEKVAKMVDDRMSAILRSNSALNHTKIGVLTALNLADDLAKARQKIDDLKVKHQVPMADISETKKQVLEMTKQIIEAENLYNNILEEMNQVASRRREQEKMISNLTLKLEKTCEEIVDGDEALNQAMVNIALLEKKLLLRESEIAEYIKVFDELEKEKLDELKSYDKDDELELEEYEYEYDGNDIIFEGEIED